MGGGIGCCTKNSTSSCQPGQCGNLFTDYTSNPYAEFNMFMDPFAAYQVLQKSIGIFSAHSLLET